MKGLTTPGGSDKVVKVDLGREEVVPHHDEVESIEVDQEEPGRAMAIVNPDQPEYDEFWGQYGRVEDWIEQHEFAGMVEVSEDEYSNYLSGSEDSRSELRMENGTDHVAVAAAAAAAPAPMQPPPPPPPARVDIRKEVLELLRRSMPYREFSLPEEWLRNVGPPGNVNWKKPVVDNAEGPSGNGENVGGVVGKSEGAVGNTKEGPRNDLVKDENEEESVEMDEV